MKNCDSCKLMKEGVSDVVRKVIKDLDISAVDAITILIQGINIMCHSYKDQFGEQGLKKLFEDLDEHSAHVFNMCFHLCEPVNAFISKKWSEKDERLHTSERADRIPEERNSERNSES